MALKSPGVSIGMVQSMMSSWPGVKYAKVLSTDASGDLTVTFPTGMFSAPPVVHASVISGASTDQYYVEIVGVPDATTAIIKVRKQVGLTLTVVTLGLAVNLFASSGVTNVSVVACDSI